MFTRLNTEPTTKVEVQYDKDDSRLLSLTKINALPPFSILYFEIVTSSTSYRVIQTAYRKRVTKSMEIEKNSFIRNAPTSRRHLYTWGESGQV